MRGGAALLALLIAAAFLGCGGGGDSTSTSDSTPAGSGSTTTEGSKGAGSGEGSDDRASGGKATGSDSSSSGKGGGSGEAVAPAPPVDHDDSGGGVKQFIHQGSDNSIQESGSEASDSEREDAAVALHGFLDSTARGNWGSACYYLSQGTYKQLLASFKIEDGSCPVVLEGFFGGVPKGNFVEAAKADVGSFRVEGDRGFLLYRGAENLDYQMPMVLEGGEWKVAAIAGSALL